MPISSKLEAILVKSYAKQTKKNKNKKTKKHVSDFS